MSVVIRMQRAGGRNRPFYRVVVADSRVMRDGRFLEKVGFYNPLTQPAVVDIDEERVRYWVERGAKPSESVASLLKRSRKGLTATTAMQAPKAQVAAAAPMSDVGTPAPEPVAEPVVEAPDPVPAGDIPAETQEAPADDPDTRPSDEN